MTHAVIFDIDGTLLESAARDDELYRAAVSSVLGDVRLRAALADYEFVTDTGILLRILDDNGMDRDPQIVEAVRREFETLLREHIRRHGPFAEVPGARSLIRRLSASKDHSVAIATGGWRSTAELKLASSGFEFDGVPLCSADDAVDRRRIMQLALQALGTSVRSVVYYGDGDWDRAACASLEWEFRAVGAGLGGIAHFHDEFTGGTESRCRS